MNTYEAKQAARKAGYQAKAAQAERQADAAHAQAHDMAQAIPFGQPILVGHHSERGDRRYRERIHQGYEKSFELQKKAEHYADKAAAVGKGGISSDDPDAIEKLKAKLASLQAWQDAMKKLNGVLRRHAKADPETRISALVATGLVDDTRARELIKPDFMGRIGFAPYQLQNNNANIRRIAQRIKDLEKVADRPEFERSGHGYTYREDPQENRAMFLFDGKPAKETRDLLKRHGFRWSPTRSAWVRQLTGNAQWAAMDFMRALELAQRQQ
ncbi:DUF3560 domain-containing protein [Paracandidimonas soli]|uniref:Uncharacterized protein DUF3560 n=1 Tax=Paracandidimonas soli TaxID=1917182 RepID=A0A4R3VA70_9BURK|nr:DUF3560 domain-containing protein [Paracandidimonas soli]TCV00452.1 uncharacterized protein DUF3560 [Paracandidimonas soli]